MYLLGWLAATALATLLDLSAADTITWQGTLSVTGLVLGAGISGALTLRLAVRGAEPPKLPHYLAAFVGWAAAMGAMVIAAYLITPY